jgi:hypothetical protein
MRVGAYTVEPAVFTAMPESVAREECLLPLAVNGKQLRVVAGRREATALDKSLRRAAYITGMGLRYSVAEYAQVAALVNELFNKCFTEVSGCVAEFEVKCPRRWLELAPTAAPPVRDCSVCQQQVFWANDAAEALAYARMGRCVALFRSGVESEIGMLRVPGEGARRRTRRCTGPGRVNWFR